MKRCIAAGVAPLFLAAALPACYEAATPLDPTPQVDLDPALMGAWRCVGSEPKADEAAFTLLVEATAPRVTRATLAEDGDPTPDVYEGHGSRVGQRTVLNMRELDEAGQPKKAWWFVRYQLARPQVLLVELADHDALKAVDPSVASLRKALARTGKDDPFRLLCVCVRARTSKERSG